MENLIDRFGISGKSVNLPLRTGQQDFGDIHNDLIDSYSPVDGKLIAQVAKASSKDYERLVELAGEASIYWRNKSAPFRGDIIRQFGNQLRENKDALGKLVSYEMGKSWQEGKGEVQEVIDICDFAQGLSRQLHGATMHSERFEHRMYEQWHPLGIVGIITAFNFPVAVWGWNAVLAAVCGNVSLWKPSEKTPLCSLACLNLWKKVVEANNLPEGIINLIIGDVDPIGHLLTNDKKISLVSATGSTAMGKQVAQSVSRRLGKYILELGGNNAIILTPNADLSNAIPSVVFGAVGTAGQRCTSTRRLIVHSSIFRQVEASLVKAYNSLKIGNPLDEKNHMGPLIDKSAVDNMLNALSLARKEGGEVLFGGKVLDIGGFSTGCYVSPCLVKINHQASIVKEETFAPILYLMEYTGELEEAIKIQNNVPQGLSSAIFTLNLHEAENFLGPNGSDCGLANVNIGTSGAEIGGAFGGEKDTGGGRESGSDCWKYYMRRQTNTINYGKEAPLAQGIKFDLS
ncbi:MAG: aldehyde dehydrogenase family protein [Zetaproteobacteria bacterium]|nr:aldehyde dehydrogenase family protein [Pseudobdellovibrionaceae bacterium]